MDIQKALEEINVLIKDVTDPVAKVIISRLLNVIEALVQENKALKEENQKLRDEINRLKGEQGKPNIQKSLDSIEFLQKWLKNNQKASMRDRATAENILIDLKDGIGKKPWYSQTKPPKP